MFRSMGRFLMGRDKGKQPHGRSREMGRQIGDRCLKWHEFNAGGYMAAKSLEQAVSAFGREAKSKLANAAIAGAPEDQLRGPLELLIKDVAELAGFIRGTVVPVGETSLTEVRTRPDY